MPMIKPGEFGKDSHYFSSTYTSELDPIINQQIGNVPKPDNWVQNDTQHQLPDASQYNPIKSLNFTQDNADKDILNKMDAMDLSHTRLLTDGVLSANGHEHVLHPKDFTDHKNAQGRKTIELEG
ncbi:hypothetical protein niasHT_033002 [Heterodera trifolii]|uniref:Uncharacterized protein n=1 Tax=Heterodera trifolii TaxID=157864 RepID=A0ABD2IM41_9BILA